MDVGLGLWAMQATAAAPASWPALHLELQEDARLAERLGFHSVWVSEHHFWYDGWCPSAPAAAAAVLGATERLHAGTGVHVLPLHDPERVADAAATLHRLSGGRFELGVGLGYRDAEYDGFGVSRRRRGRRMDAALEVLTARAGPRIWVGGFAPASLARAARHGLGVLLPSTVRRPDLAALATRLRDEGASAIAVMKHAWVTGGGADDERRARERIVASSREYAGAWWRLKGRPAHTVPDLLEAQMRRTAETAIVGPPAHLAEELDALGALGADLVVLHVATDRMRPAHRDAMETIAAEVLPA